MGAAHHSPRRTPRPSHEPQTERPVAAAKPLRVTWIYGLPTWLFMSVCVVGACALASALLAVTRLRLTRNEQITHNDVAGPVLTIIGTVLAVMMSFMVVGVWQEYDGAAATAQNEASALSDLYHLAATFPQPVRRQTQDAVNRYIGLVINREWPEMQSGGEDARADRAAYEIGGILADWRPATAGQQEIKAQAMSYTSTLWDARRNRILANRQGIPIVLWATMLFTGLVTIVFTFYFRVENVRAQHVMVIAVTAVITVIFTLIAELDYPFRGSIAIAPDSFLHVFYEIHGIVGS